MHIEGDWHQHFYQNIVDLIQGSHTKKQHGRTRLGGICYNRPAAYNVLLVWKRPEATPAFDCGRQNVASCS